MNQSSEIIIECPNCGQRNRISNSLSMQNKRPICSKCWSSLILKNERKDVPSPPEPDVSPKEQVKTENKGESFFSGRNIFVLIIIIGVVGWLFFNDSSTPNRKNYSLDTQESAPIQPSYPSDTQESTPIEPSYPSDTKESAPIEPSYSEQALPNNGAVQSFTSDEPIAPLEIKGGSGSNYLVKLVDAYTKDPIMTIFVHSDSTVTVDVPLGSYEFRYAAGEKWYGDKYLFGPNTSYSKADKIFDFVKTGYQVSGYTVTLYKVSHGNLRTSRIGAAQF